MWWASASTMNQAVDRGLNAYLGSLGFPDAKVLFMDELPPPDAYWRGALKASYEFLKTHKLGDHIAAPRSWRQAFGTGQMMERTDVPSSLVGLLAEFYAFNARTTATKPCNPHDDRTITIGQLKGVAAGLVNDGDPLDGIELYDGTNEYIRGMSELIGRSLLDLLGVGDGTGENAKLIAAEIAAKFEPEPKPVKTTITATVTMPFFGTTADAQTWAENHTIFEMLDARGVNVDGPNIA
jgi:hypothetical protein